MFLPPVFGSTRGEDDIYGNWSFEIVIMVLFADIRLGFNPTYISQSVESENVWAGTPPEKWQPLPEFSKPSGFLDL